MNAIGPVVPGVPAAPEGAHPHLWGQEHRMIRGDLWNELFVWGHRRGMSDVHPQTNHRVMIDVDGRFYPATRRAITAEEMNSAVTLLYGVTGPAHLKKAESFDLAHVVEPERGERYSLGGRAAHWCMDPTGGVQIRDGVAGRLLPRPGCPPCLSS